MIINQNKNGSQLELALEGRLDTITALQLEEFLHSGLSGVEALVMDLKDLAYISSAGLRILLTAQQQMSAQGTMVIRNVCPAVMGVFEITGFCDILNIE